MKKLFCLLLALGFEACCLGFKIRRIISFVWVKLSAVNFADPFCYVVQEIAIMRYGQNSARITLEELFKPEYRFCI